MKKLKNKKGFTLVEMLASLVLLGFVVLIVGGGANVAMKTYKESISYSESNTLASTLMFSIENEVRYASAINETNNEISSFTSPDYGNGASFKIDNGKLKIATNSNSFSVVGDKAYTNGLAVESIKLEKGEKTTKGQIIDITLKLSGGTQISTKVLNLNI